MALLQPRHGRGNAPFEALDLGHLFERQTDVVEAFKQADTVGRRNVEGEIAAARAADALCHEARR